MDEDVKEPETGSMQDLFKAVKELKDAVADVKEGSVDKELLDRRMSEAMGLARRQGSGRPEGFVPEDQDERASTTRLSAMAPADRLSWVLAHPAKRAAAALRRPVEEVRHFQRTSDRLAILSCITKQAPHELDFFHDEYLPARQAAMDTKTVGEGKELLPLVPAISSDIIERIEGDLQVLALFPEITMPTNPFRFPTKGPRKRLAVLAEAIETGTPKAKQLIPGMPSYIELAATKFAGEIVTSKELEEEAAIALLPWLESELFDWLAFDLEDACINGDTANTMDAGVPADDPKTGWDGLRKRTPATAKFDAGGTALELTDLLATRALMGRYGLNPADLVLLLSVPSLYDLIGAPEVKTVDTYGQNATLLSGELGRIWGTPIIASDQIPVTCDATGVVPAVAGTKTIAMYVRKDAFMHGVRRNASVQILTELYAESDQDAVLLTTRQAFGARWPGEPAVAQAINVG